MYDQIHSSKMSQFKQIKSNWSETDNLCTNVECQKRMSALRNSFNRLNDRYEKVYPELLELRTEVEMLRRWAKLQKLVPPSPPPSENKQDPLAIEPNYEHYMDGCEQLQQQQENDKIKIEDGASVIVDVENDDGPTSKILNIGEEIKVESAEPVDSDETSSSTTTSEKSTSEPFARYYQCGLCPKEFKLARNLKKHVSLIHMNGKYIPKTLSRYSTPINQIDEFECYLCKKRFKLLPSLRYHMAKHHTELTMKPCRICDDLSIETKHSCVGLKLDCEYCSKSFESLHQLNVHLDDDHAEGVLYQCTICGQPFRMRSFLDHHKSKHVAGSFACKDCPQRFDQKKQLRQHRITSHPNNIHLCDECGKAFRCTQILKKHKITHGNKAFKCTTCPYASVTKQNLKIHMRIHSNDSLEYRCHICSKQFTKIGSLQTHIKTHTSRNESDRIHACHLCPKKFFRQGHLKTHIKGVHNSGKTFECSYCDKAYKHSGDLTKHLRTHLGDNMYKCPDCPAEFRVPLELQRHSYTHFGKADDSAPTNST